MSIVQFALFAPIVLFAFAAGLSGIESAHCRSKALEKIVARSLAKTVERAWLSQAAAMDISCGFSVRERAAEATQAVFWKTGRALEVKFKLESGIAP